MSAVRLVRCPNCSQVLQEPLDYAIYKCGACGVVLAARRSTFGDGGASEKSVNWAGESESEEGFGGSLNHEGAYYRSKARSCIGDGVGDNSAMGERENGLAEFDEGFPKSPMRDELLGNIGSIRDSPMRSRNASRSPVRGRAYGDFGFDGVGKSPARGRNVSELPVRAPVSVRSRDVTKSPLREERTPGEFDEGYSKSPMRERFLNDLGSIPNSPMRSRNVNRSGMRERGSGDFDFNEVGESSTGRRNVSKSPMRDRRAETPMSVRTRDVTRSPLRERRTTAASDGVSESSARSVNTYIPESPMKRDNVSKFGRNAETKQQETIGDHFGVKEEADGRKITPITSFSSWASGDKHMSQSDGGNYTGGRRRTWRDQVNRIDQISQSRESVYSDEHGMTPEALSDNFIYPNDPSEEKIDRYMRIRGGYGAGHAKFGGAFDQRGIINDGIGGIHGNSKLPFAGGRISASLNHSDDGYGEPRRNVESVRGPASVQDLELEHAELLRKYNELKGQIGNLEDKRFSPSGFYRGSRSDDYSTDGSWRFRQGSVQQFMMERNMRRPNHFNHGLGPAHHLTDKYNYAPRLYDDPNLGQVTRAPCRNPLYQVVEHSVAERFDQDSLESYHDKSSYHHPSCTCSLCYVDDWQGQNLPDSTVGGVPSNIRPSHRPSHSFDVERHGRRAYIPRMAQSNPLDRPSYIAQRHPAKVPVTNPNKRLCYPISGGAPFVLCKKCFRLLKLPKKVMLVENIKNQVQCGVCSSVMSFDLSNGSSALLSSEKEPETVDASSSLDKVSKESVLEHHRKSCAATTTNIGSYDFDAIGASFESIDSEPFEVPKEQKSGISVAESEEHLSPSSSHSSKDHISDNVSAHSLPNSAEMPLKTNLIRPPPGSPLRDHFDYSTCLRKIEGGEVATSAVEEKQISEKDTSSVSSTENTAVTTEIDVHSSEVPTTNYSQDSLDTSREVDKDENNKDRKSSMSTFTKWGFVSRGSPGRAEVCVNGQPIQHHLVKRAEKLAGPVRPGDYWYDPKAGFWGVMGHHCLGIIPPFIQEFGFPMPRNCSGGNTTVSINGRELHERDLELLASRGLPTTVNKSYIIDISGKLLDEETKECVANLGKLAPTVEKKKRGFGMQVPAELDYSG